MKSIRICRRCHFRVLTSRISRYYLETTEHGWICTIYFNRGKSLGGRFRSPSTPHLTPTTPPRPLLKKGSLVLRKQITNKSNSPSTRPNDHRSKRARTDRPPRNFLRGWRLCEPKPTGSLLPSKRDSAVLTQFENTFETRLVFGRGGVGGEIN